MTSELRDGTLTGWLAHHAAARPEAPALIDTEGTLTYRDLQHAVALLASGLARLGLAKGDVLAVQLPNTRSYLIAFLAAAARGLVFQTLHMPYRKSELQGLLRDSGAKAVIVTHQGTDSRAHDVLSVRDSLSALQTVIVAGAPLEGCSELAALMQHAADEDARIQTGTDDRYLLLYTSGTTSSPKGVPHPYRGFLNNALDATAELGITSQSRVLSLAPMTHLYGLFTMNLALAAGAAMVLVPMFNPKTLLQDLQQARASHVFSAPAHFAPLVGQALLKSEHLVGIQGLCLSGAPVPFTLAQTIDGLMPDGGVFQLWGMSELQAGTYGRPDDPAETRFGTAGTPAPGTHLRVVDETGATLPADTEGSLQVRGPSVFKGYLDRPSETQDSFDSEGWFVTGDLAVIDAAGFVSITGRTKEIINRGGVKFNPVEVEEILLALPAIQQCAIVPVPDSDLGERGCLCVELAPGATLSLNEALEPLSNAGLAKYKWPERLEIIDQLPMTPTKKVMRGRLGDIISKRKV
ncbi:class I adenylate-forming enzyme family protein [Shimia sediminis]|uniref:class I adenylate-forming enzyme family protein n=1 Tax=Shimia sediminis TaxID=2497945 RepID=UPI000F8E59A5|nr:class I adenylate-forming enzyme family protein [Shimia sediminis]